MNMPKINEREKNLLELIAIQLQVNTDDLYKLIDHESGWNPKAKNPLSSARGLIQFIDSTAIDLGYHNSDDLIKKNPTIIDQLPIVKNYLMRYKPFLNKQSLYLSVFYPKARAWALNKSFPEEVKKSNPGINTVADYINKVEKKIDGVKALSALGVLAIAFFLLKFIK